MAPNAGAPVIELSRLDQLRSHVESSIGSARLTTCYVGSIADGVTDEILTNIFTCCGPVKKWKRMLDATGTPKSFGFLEFVLAEGLLRLLKLLLELPIFGKALNIKVEDQTKEYLGKYQSAIKEYEASHPDSPQLSFALEDDLKALDEINAIFKERNLVPSMQFIENKVKELTMGPTEPVPVVLEHPPKKRDDELRREDQRREGQRRESKPRQPSLTGWETAGYRDRERRWEKHEETMGRNRLQDAQREADRAKKDEAERRKLISWLTDFDDSSFVLTALDRLILADDRAVERRLASSNAPTFYIHRDRWRDKRHRELQRQVEMDARDERKELEQVRVVPEEAAKKRPAPPAARRSKRARVPLIPGSQTYDELIAAGYEVEAAHAKLHDLKKDKIKLLIGSIPTERAALFSWDMDWDLVDMPKVKSWIDKNVAAWEDVKEKAILAEDLEEWVVTRVPPERMLQNMDGLPNADLFVTRLWRYLIYETEAAGHELQ